MIIYRAAKGSKLTIPELDANFQYLEDNISITPNVTYFWIPGGLTYRVRALLYPINNAAYSSVETDVTLATANGAFDRIDLIIANAAGVTTKITGTPSAIPSPPDHDEATEYPITFVTVKAGATTPDGVSVIDIYKENTEWVATETTAAARIALASLNDPFAGTKSIEATSILNGDTIRLTPTLPVNTAEITILLLQVKLKAALTNPTRIKLRFYDASGAVSDIISIGDGLYGLDTTDTSSYQQLAIPNTAFNFTSPQITYLEIWQFTNFLGWFIDDVQYQKGLGEITIVNSGVIINGNKGTLLKAPGNPTETQIEVGDVIEVFADANTVVKAKYTNALADNDTDNLGVSPLWNTGNYTPISIQDLT